MARGDADAAGMSPLQRLILDRMREQGWSPKDVEDRGVKHATLHRYMNPVVLHQLPRRAVVEALADGLRLPVEKVEEAALASLARTGTAGGTTTTTGTARGAAGLVGPGVQPDVRPVGDIDLSDLDPADVERVRAYVQGLKDGKQT